MIRFSTFLLCVLAASTILPIQAAKARPAIPGTASTELDVSSLDLNSTQGWHKAMQQITKASHAVCQRLLNENWLIGNDVAECEQDALANARSNLYALRDQQQARHQTGHVLLALSNRK